MRSRALTLAISGVLFIFPAAPALAGAGYVAKGSGGSLDTATTKANSGAVVKAARRVLAERYVLPDTAVKLDAALATAEAAGRYRGLSGEALAERLSADLWTVAKDKHLAVRYDPRRSDELAATRAAPKAGLPAGYARQVQQVNAGVRELKLLPGNIRYLALDGFYWGSPGAEDALATAMRFLKDGDAIILDLRRNGGGWPPAVAALAGYFLPAGTALTRFEMRGAPGEVNKTPAAPFSLAGKPLFVLTSPDTASAAEEFASHVGAFGFGTLVGSSTAGAAYRNDFVALPEGFYISVSVGRPVHAKTGEDWEAKGVAPAIEVLPEDALLKGQAEAMAMVAAKAPGDERVAAERLAAYYGALAKPVKPHKPAEAYAGRYGGHTIQVADGELMFSHGDRPGSRLIPLGSDHYAVEADPQLQLRFIAEGAAATMLEIGRGERTPNRIPRDG